MHPTTRIWPENAGRQGLDEAVRCSGSAPDGRLDASGGPFECRKQPNSPNHHHRSASRSGTWAHGDWDTGWGSVLAVAKATQMAKKATSYHPGALGGY